MNGKFGRKTPEHINREIEEALRAELSLTTPLAYSMEDTSGGRTGRDMLLHDLAIQFIGGSANRLYTLTFSLPGTHPTFMQINVLKFGIGTVLGAIFYATTLAKPVTSDVYLEPVKRFGPSIFVGDPHLCTRLNAHTDLIKRANTFARTQVSYGDGVIYKIPRLFKLLPAETGTRFIATTLPKPPMLKGNAILYAHEFMELAGVLEGTLYSSLRKD